MSLQLLERTLKDMLLKPLTEFAEKKIDFFKRIEFLDVDSFTLEDVYSQLYRNDVIKFTAPATAVILDFGTNFSGEVRFENVIFRGHIIGGDVVIESVEHDRKYLLKHYIMVDDTDDHVKIILR